MAAGHGAHALLLYMLLMLKNVELKSEDELTGRLGFLFELFKQYPPGADANFTELTRNFGYKSEEHTVVTKDGYIISIFRIPKGKYCLGPVKKPPVLLMHGLLTSSDSWIDAGPSAGLAYLLADACYDLWAGNVRGNYYGRRHVRLNPDTDAEFWKVSTHEMGIYDLPATVDYVLNYTNSSDLMYIGFSQGCRVFLTMCAEMIGYCDKVRVSVNMAPAVRLKYTRSVPVRLSLELYAVLAPFLNKPSSLEVNPKGGPIQTILSTICRDDFLAATLCQAVLAFLDSYDPGSITTETMKVVYDHFPGGATAYTLAIYGQTIFSQKFQKFDYGPTENLERYSDVRPPLYNLTRVSAPVVLIYGRNDHLSDSKDVRWLSRQVPNVLEIYEVERPTWNHMDDCYSQYTKQTIFPKINQYLQKYSDAR